MAQAYQYKIIICPEIPFLRRACSEFPMSTETTYIVSNNFKIQTFHRLHHELGPPITQHINKY